MKHCTTLLALIFGASGGGCIVIPVADLLRPAPLEEVVLEEGAGIFSKEKVAVLDIDGTITGDPGDGFFEPRESTVAAMKHRLRAIESDPQVKAVVLRISSPGGEVTACDVIHRAILELKESREIPVIASIVDTGASGGYYIAAAGDAIDAHPTAVVGSIGVMIQSFNVAGLFEKIGLSVTTIQAGEFKDLASPFREAKPSDAEILQAVVDPMHARFVDVVDQGRAQLTREQVTGLADGKVHVAARAVELGLIDRTAYLEETIAEAARLADMESPTVIRYSRAGRRSSSVYALAPQSARKSDLSIQLDVESLPRTRFLYLWQP